MSAGLPLLILMLLGGVINLSWMFGRKNGRRWRIAFGGVLFLGLMGSVAVLFASERGIWSDIGSNAFTALWITSVAMVLSPIIERLSFSR